MRDKIILAEFYKFEFRVFLLDRLLHNSNLRSSLLRCGTRPNELGTQ